MSFLGGSINSQTLNGIESITDGYITIQDGTISNLQELSIGGDVTVGTNLYVGGKITCAYTASLNTDVPNKLYVDLGLSSLNTSQFLKLSGGTMTGGVNMGAQVLTNLPYPSSNSSDAVNKSYCDTNDNLRLNLAGGSMTGAIAMGGNKITGLATGVSTTDACNVGQMTTQIQNAVVGTYLNLAGGTMSGGLNMGAQVLTNLPYPSANSSDAVNKSYCDTNDNLRLLKAGDTMTGTLNMNGNTILNLSTTSISTSAVNKAQMDSADAVVVTQMQTADNLRLLLDGTNSMTGSLNMNSNSINNVPSLGAGTTISLKISAATVMQMQAAQVLLSQPINMGGKSISNLANPTTNISDATNKNYVDSNDNLRLKLDGTTPMTGSINCNGNNISNIGSLQSQVASTLNLQIGSTTVMQLQATQVLLSQPINMNGNNLSNVNIINSPATTPLYISNNNAANCMFDTSGLVMSTGKDINMNGNYIHYLQSSITAGDAVNRGEIANSIIPLTAWRSGDTIQTVLNGTSLGQVLYNSYIYGGVTGSLAAANVTSIFYALSFTPKSTSSIIYATFDGSATMAGGDTDSFKCYVAKYVGTTTTSYMMHNTYTTGAGGMRGTSVFPITACWNNTTLTAYTIGCYFDTQGADDTITFSDKFNVRIQEIKI